MSVRENHRREVIDRLTDVFRVHGYEGATLSRIARETGLQKASLYHLFPGGKEEMAQVVLRDIGLGLKEMLATTVGRSGTPAERASALTNALRTFYEDGRRSCLLETLSLGEPAKTFRPLIEEAMSTWRAAMTGLAREAGFPPGEATRRAERCITLVQGALVVTRVMGDHKIFADALDEVPRLLTQP